MPPLGILKIGLDFGTTFCFCGFLQGSDPAASVRSLISPTENYGVPSVFFDDGSQKLIGHLASKKLESTRYAPYAVASVKRRLTEAGTLLDSGKTQYTAEMIVTEIISYMVSQAVRTAEENYQLDFADGFQVETVITVPVGFTEPMKQLIRRAASAVRLPNGKPLTVSGLLPEPVAAAIEYFGLRHENNADILVFDLGGGTFDTAWVHANADTALMPYEVLDQDGDPELGGDDWDEAIAQWLREGFERENNSPVNDWEMKYLRRIAREMKEALTNADFVEEDIDLHGALYRARLTRTDFDRMTAHLMQRAMERLERILLRRGKMPDHVILTGGSSYMQQVKRTIQDRFSGTDVRMLDPAHAIANGAARYAARAVLRDRPGVSEKAPSMQGNGVIGLVSSHAYAIRYQDNDADPPYLLVHIPKGAKLPYVSETRSETYKQTDSVVYAVYEIDSGKDLKPMDRLPLEEGVWIMQALLSFGSAVPAGTDTLNRLILTINEELFVQAFNERKGVRTENHVSVRRNNETT